MPTLNPLFGGVWLQSWWLVVGWAVAVLPPPPAACWQSHRPRAVNLAASNLLQHPLQWPAHSLAPGDDQIGTPSNTECGRHRSVVWKTTPSTHSDGPNFMNPLDTQPPVWGSVVAVLSSGMYTSGGEVMQNAAACSLLYS